MSRTPQQELVNFVSDMYSVELQALAQLVSAPDIALPLPSVWWRRSAAMR